MSRENKYKIGISIGDINGIGPEVIIKTFNDQRILDQCTPVIYGSSKAISYHRKALDMENFNFSIAQDSTKLNNKTANIINCWNEEVNITFGELSEETGKYALQALDVAVDDLINNNIDALITAPVNKKSIQLNLPDFYGQTEFLAQRLNIVNSLMFLISGDLRVGLVTNHVPVNNIAQLITVQQILEKIDIMNNSLKRDFQLIKPRIAVLGLNPHAGDNGAIGNEEIEIIAPAIQQAKDKGILVFGPYSADGFFGSSAYKKFDGILAMYHDQGLIPFKALTFGSGINYTAGLPVIRTSPDHGTAFEIAGKNIASEESFRNSLFLAMDIIRNRREFDDMNKNPLTKTELSREIN